MLSRYLPSMILCILFYQEPQVITCYVPTGLLLSPIGQALWPSFEDSYSMASSAHSTFSFSSYWFSSDPNSETPNPTLCLFCPGIGSLHFYLANSFKTRNKVTLCMLIRWIFCPCEQPGLGGLIFNITIHNERQKPQQMHQ